MFSDLRHHPELTQQAHRALAAVSASDLLKWDKARRGDADAAPDWALYEGSCLHTAVLEPHLWDAENLPKSGDDERRRAAMLALAKHIRERADVAALLKIGYAEQTYTARHNATGVLVKGRPDLLTLSYDLEIARIYDVKTTSCTSEAAFRESITKYRYPVPAALYCDVLGAHGFTWIACCKKAPYDVWFVDMDRTQWLSGRAEYAELLTCYAEAAA